jgi:hypothetical protein
MYDKLINWLCEQMVNLQQDLRDTEQQNANLRATVAILEEKLMDR